MGSKKRYEHSKGNKRKFFRGSAKNTDKIDEEQEQKQDIVVTEENPKSSASADKIDLQERTEKDFEDEHMPECNFLMNSDLFISLLLLVARCPDCLSAINVVHLQSKMGLAHFFELKCVSCIWKIKLCSSKECNRTSNSSGRHS